MKTRETAKFKDDHIYKAKSERQLNESLNMIREVKNSVDSLNEKMKNSMHDSDDDIARIKINTN
jgi:hypothetical protein